MKTVPSVNTLSINTIYLQYTAEGTVRGNTRYVLVQETIGNKNVGDMGGFMISVLKDKKNLILGDEILCQEKP